MAKILIVDDAAFMRMMIKDILTKNGYEVVAEAANGVEAVELYKSHQPDLVTMDITMPEMDGIEAVKQIKAVNPAAKVMMCFATYLSLYLPLLSLHQQLFPLLLHQVLILLYFDFHFDF